MTRTERSISPRAMLKDRSESKTGLDKSIRKGGGGAHNWGSLSDEHELETAALRDEELDFEAEESINDSSSTSSEPIERKKSTKARSFNEEELESAKQFRKNVFKSDGIDLSAIARTSAAVSASPPNKIPHISQDTDSIV